jgi:aminoglycoside phosphotransferase (APT) family kinase protein
LASGPIPPALEHGDLHDGNIFASGRIYDWGDASLTHPFFTLILPIRHTAAKLEVSEYTEHPALLQLRDAYLNEWRDFASFDELVAIWNIAFRLGKFVRAVSWYSVVKLNDPAHGDPYQGWVAGWLLEGLNHAG